MMRGMVGWQIDELVEYVKLAPWKDLFYYNILFFYGDEFFNTSFRCRGNA